LGNAVREDDQIFPWYSASRSLTIGSAEAAAFVAPLAKGSRVLDAGCGTGIPVTQLLVARGLDTYGIDSSPRMIEAYRSNFPSATAACASVLESALFCLSFDAVVAWGVMFHLSAEEQVLAIARFAKSLRMGGRLLFTAGKDRGESESPMNGVMFRYISLGSNEYQRVLHENGCDLLEEFFDDGHNYYYVAERVA
jgi:2-polyprenyl-3-methyl-5-hydroxy-6-metoxy-1,4-benzoquinol methylase